MNAEIKTKWVAALRSGKYKQGQHQLRTLDNKFCCLGVLCDVIDSSKWQTDQNRYWLYHDVSATLPVTAKGKVKLSNSEEHTLISLNDVHRMSFEDIANYIEQNL